MNELQQLETKIRQALPRLQEVSEGCMFKIKNMPFDYEYLYLIYDENDYGIEIATLYNGEIDVFDYEYFLNQDITIIGHNIYLSDVLEWFVVSFEPRYDTDQTAVNIMAQWVLSKPLLKDQPKEVVEYLNGLK